MGGRRVLCRNEGVPLSLVRALQAPLGFPLPEPADRAWDGDRDLVDLVRTLLAAGASQAVALGLVRVYADSLHRVAEAEAELYESEIEQPLRRSGRSEQDIRDYGARFSDGVITSLERALVDIYRRHRERVWIDTASPTPSWPWSARVCVTGIRDRPPSASFI
jgi:hypothetical protein